MHDADAHVYGRMQQLRLVHEPHMASLPPHLCKSPVLGARLGPLRAHQHTHTVLEVLHISCLALAARPILRWPALSRVCVCVCELKRDHEFVPTSVHSTLINPMHTIWAADPTT